ncbi:MAG: CoA pyrophosphatase [Taibaiella sp.]|nr:CoA pyrophosphatase [Taibaiella sp.]
MNHFVQWLKDRMLEPLPGYTAQKRMSKSLYRPQPDEAPPNAKESAVLILLFEEAGALNVLLIMRTADGGAHSGQIAFPGGKKEPEDPGYPDTALREANEELSLDPQQVQVIGSISPLYIPVSNFIVHPVVAYADQLPDLEKSEFEVAEIFQIPLSTLFDSKQDTVINITLPLKGKIDITAYIINESVIVWGATAMILSELESLWDEFHGRQL